MNFHCLKQALLAVALFSLPILGHALNLDDPIPVGPQVLKGQLANGLTYYIQRNTKPQRKTELRLVVKAGSAMEDDDQKGLAHLLEHMAFNGSTHFKKHELVSYLQSMGLRFGADLNAYTTFNETVYILPLPTVKPSELAMGMQVLQDWAHGMTLRDEDIDAERGIVLEELRLGKGVQDRISKQVVPTLFQGSKYAERLPIGNEHALKTFDANALRRFYKDWYRPNRMAVVAVGDFDPVAMEVLIKHHFEPLKNPVPERSATIIDVPARTKTAALSVTDSEASTRTLQMVYSARPSIDAVRLKDYRADAVEMLFNALMDQRMDNATQQAKPPFIGGTTSIQKTMPGYKAFSMTAGINREGLQNAMSALVQESRHAKMHGFTQSELDRAKKNYMSNLQQVHMERNKTESAIYAAEYIRNFLVNESIPGIVEELRINKEMLPAITLSEMNAFAAKTIPSAEDPVLLIYTGPSPSAQSPAPSEEELKAMLAGSFNAPLVAKQTALAVDTEMLASFPKEGTIVERIAHPKVGVTEYILSNGLRALVKPTALKEGQLLMSASRFGGQSLFEDADKLNATYTVAVANAMGLGPHSPTTMDSLLAGNMSKMDLSMGLYSETLLGQTTPQDVQTMFKMLHLRFAPMRKDTALFNAFISRAQDATALSRVRPDVQFSDALVKALNQNHPRVGLSPTPDDFASLSLDRIAGIYNTRFSSAKGFTFHLVGNIDPDKVEGWLTKYIASLPTTSIPTTFRDLGIRTPNKPLSVQVHKGSEPKSMVTMTFAGPAPISDGEQLRVQVLMEIINLRIVDVLREQKTWLYSGGISGSLAYVPYEQYFIRATLPGSPDHVEDTLQIMEQEIRTLQREGPRMEDMSKVMMNWFSLQAKREQDNEYWLGQMQLRTLYNKPVESMLGWPKMAMQLTLADIKKAANDYLPLDNYVRGVLLPDTTVQSTAASK